MVAGVVSGLPSTVHALVSGRSPLAAARAAGALLGRPGIGRGLLAHAAISVGWTTVLRVALPPRSGALGGAIAGIGIGLLDLAIADRRYPAVAALPRLPQLADHALFGALVGLVLHSRRDGVANAHAVVGRLDVE